MFDKNSIEDAVSPVVGVILMVAVTVILAAVIGSFVLDLGSNVEANPQAGVTFSQDATNDSATVQIISLENADDISLSVDSSASASVTNPFPSTPSVGDTAEVNGADGETGTITAVGTLNGKDAVLQTYDFEF